MITRCPGISTGLGYIVGGGYKGITKELDDAVHLAAETLKQAFGCNIVVRFNSDRNSGGAFIKDDESDAKIGLCVRLSCGTPKRMEDVPPYYYTVLDKSLMADPCKNYLYPSFDSLKGALTCLRENASAVAVEEYLRTLQSIKPDMENL